MNIEWIDLKSKNIFQMSSRIALIVNNDEFQNDWEDFIGECILSNNQKKDLL